MQKKKGAIIALVGPHYSGKSALAKKLSTKAKCIQIEEKWAQDPFREFRKKGDYLKSQFWFLLETMKIMLEARETKKTGEVIILDTFVNTTRSFCRSKLNPTDFKTFNSIFEEITKDFPLPDLIIYLTASAAVLKERSQLRAKLGTGPTSDAHVEINWINKTIDANQIEFGNWKKTPIIKINTGKEDLINNEEHFQKLLTTLKKYI